MTLELATTLTATDDERLLQAESAVRGYCGWHIAPVRTSETFTTDAPFARERLYLPTLHLVNVTDIDIVGALTSFDATAYQFHVSGWVEPSPGHFWPTPRPGSRLIVTFDHGYATVPPAVQGAVQSIAQRSVSNPSGLIRDRVGPFIEDYGFGMGEADKVALGPYVIPLT